MLRLNNPTGHWPMLGIRLASLGVGEGAELVKVLGLRTFRDHLTWSSMDGTDRQDATISNEGKLSIPSAGRGDELVWVRQEIAALIAEERPDSVVVSPAEGSTVSAALIERAHVDAIVLATLSELKVPVVAKKAATIRAAFGAKTNAHLATHLANLPGLAGIKPTSARRDPVIAAVSGFPE